ncbi:MAG: hypothetical protein FJ090_01230 [Deltaproteobacteria bacterium]|nr:hypothetical protein [Deltaproteobacteria bacterium]
MTTTTRRIDLVAFQSAVQNGAPELRILTRFLGTLVWVTAALAVYLWTRMEVRETSRLLDIERAALAEQLTLRERLQVERTMLRSPGRLGAVALSENLAAPARVIDVVVAR